MADRILDPTVLLTKQAGDTLTEIRDTNYGILRSIEASTPFYKGLTSELRDFASKQMDRTFQMSAIPESVIATTESETFDIPSNLSESEIVTATVYSLFSGFKAYDAMFGENDIARQEYIKNKMEEIDKAFALAKTNTFLTVIDGQKTQVLSQNAAANKGYSFAASVLTANLNAQARRIFPDLNVIMQDNGLEMEKLFAVSTGIKILENFTEMYGAANAQNLQGQDFIPQMHVDNRITNTANFTGYLFEKGAFASIDNIKWDFLNGSQVGEAVFGVSNNILPKLGSQVGVYSNRFLNDSSALMDNTASWKMSTGEEWGFLHRYVVLTPYNSDISTRVNPVVKIVGGTV